MKGLKQALLSGKRGAAVPAAPVVQHKRAARCIVRASGLDKKKINKVSNLRSLLQREMLFFFNDNMISLIWRV